MTVPQSPRLNGHGFSVTPPAGWEGRIYRRLPPATANTPQAQVAGAGVTGWLGDQTLPVVHLADFALPASRGDYGSGAVEIMRSTDTFIALLQFGPECLGSELFRSDGRPRVEPARFNPNGLQRIIPGQAGAQYFFTEGGRPLCLYVVLGSRTNMAAMTKRVNRAGPAEGGRGMSMAISERLVNKISRRRGAERSRRGFLAGAALAGAALAVNPWGFLVRSAGAYAAVCGSASQCADGYSVFCCTINGGINSCPPNSFIGGWWKADNSSFCGGSARYYIDCNAYANSGWQCHCASGTCDSRRVACNQFRYGQCNLSIPYSQTGPVVCRIISCTPPWQQFGGVCTSSSATDNATATHTAPCVGVLPRGFFDSAVAVGQAIRVRGWSFDPDQPVTAVQITVQLDGAVVSSAVTAVPRPDVNRAYRITGNHGFDVQFAAGPGRHTVAIYATSIAGGAGRAQIGSCVVAVAAPNLPFGYLDSSISLPGGRLRLRGWALDRDQPATAIKVSVYLDGIGVNRFPTGVPRADVNRAMHVSGNHGFDITIKAAIGSHKVDVYGINVGGGNANRLIGSATTKVSGTGPVGVLDTAVAVGRTVVLTGWAFDPDQPGTSIPVAVWRDGVTLAWYPTNVARADVDRVYRVSGTHGYRISVPTTPGRHQFLIYGKNIAPAGPNPVIGHAWVVVPA